MFTKTPVNHGSLRHNNPLTFSVLAVLFIIAFSFSETISLLINYWVSDSSYSHGPLIACISLYLFIWHHKLQLYKTKTKAMPFAIPIFMAALFIWWSGTAISIQVLQVTSLPLILLSIFYCLWGKEVLRIALFPVLFIYLSIPVWTIILSPLQNMTLWINAELISIVGIPAFIEGTNVHIPAGIFSIEHGCAGLKYFLSSLSTILLMTHLSKATIQVKFLVIALAILIALIANWTRVFLIIVIGHNSNMQHSIVNDHSNFGWLIFAIFFLPLILSCHKILLINSVKSTNTPLNTLSTSPEESVKKHTRKQLFIAIIILALTLLTTNLLSPLKIKSTNPSKNIQLPEINTNWNGPLMLHDEIELPIFYGFDEMASGIYRTNNLTAKVAVIKYQNQQQGSELIHYENNLYDEDQWDIIEHETIILVEDNNGNKNSINKKTLQSNNKKGKRHIYYWYRIGQFQTSSKIEAKLLQIPSLLNGRSDADLYYISVYCKDQCNYEIQKINPLLTKLMDQ